MRQNISFAKNKLKLLSISEIFGGCDHKEILIKLLHIQEFLISPCNQKPPQCTSKWIDNDVIRLGKSNRIIPRKLTSDDQCPLRRTVTDSKLRATHSRPVPKWSLSDIWCALDYTVQRHKLGFHKNQRIGRLFIAVFSVN